MIAPDQIEGKAEMLIDFEDRLTIFDSLILCRFYRDLYTWELLEEIIYKTTGNNATKPELRSIASNITTLIRKFNIREGLRPEHDHLPPGFYKKLRDSGRSLRPEEFHTMLKEYYSLRGWNKKGIPLD